MNGSETQTQLVWDRECDGTAQADGGCCLHTGPGSGWSAGRLLVAAVESDVMATFLQAADEAGLQVMGYVSAAEAVMDHDPSARLSILVRPCIVVGREEDRHRVQRLAVETLGRSPIARALGESLRIHAEVVVVPPAGPD